MYPTCAFFFQEISAFGPTHPSAVVLSCMLPARVVGCARLRFSSKSLRCIARLCSTLPRGSPHRLLSTGTQHLRGQTPTDRGSFFVDLHRCVRDLKNAIQGEVWSTAYVNLHVCGGPVAALDVYALASTAESLRQCLTALM